MALNNNVYSPFMFRLAKKVGTIGPELAEQQMCKRSDEGQGSDRKTREKPGFSAVMATLDDKRSYKGDAKRSGILTDSGDRRYEVSFVYIRYRSRLGTNEIPDTSSIAARHGTLILARGPLLHHHA